MSVPLKQCKRRLTMLWFIGSGVLFFLLVTQAIFGRYGSRTSEAFGWLLPTVIPTLSLIVGVLVWEAIGKGTKKRTVDRFIYRVSFNLSLIYFITALMTLLLQPFSDYSILELMHLSNLWLGPLQGLVAASLGAFFVNKDN